MLLKHLQVQARSWRMMMGFQQLKMLVPTLESDMYRQSRVKLHDTVTKNRDYSLVHRMMFSPVQYTRCIVRWINVLYL